MGEPSETAEFHTEGGAQCASQAAPEPAEGAAGASRVLGAPCRKRSAGDVAMVAMGTRLKNPRSSMSFL